MYVVSRAGQYGSQLPYLRPYWELSYLRQLDTTDFFFGEGIRSQVFF